MLGLKEINKKCENIQVCLKFLSGYLKKKKKSNSTKIENI